MSRRFRCRACRASFLSSEDRAGVPVVCPKCGADQAEAAPVPPAAGAPPGASVFVPTDAPPRSRRRKRLTVFVLALLIAAGVSVAVAWPTLRAWWKPTPPDPVESVAAAYLQALVDGNSEAARRLGTVDLPPAIRTFRQVRHEPKLDDALRGSFGPIASFQAKVDESFAYDPAAGRFTPRNALGPAAETLDALHGAKAAAEKEGLYKKMQSGDPEDIFDAAEGLAKPLAALAAGVLSPRKLVPTYQQLVEDARPPLPPAERSLALDYASRRETWDALLRRPFVTLKADGPFLLERAEVTASVIDALGSSGDPPTRLHLTLTRFRLEGIDTGWRVTATRRELPAAEDAAVPAPSPAETSPGQTPR